MLLPDFGLALYLTFQLFFLVTGGVKTPDPLWKAPCASDVAAYCTQYTKDWSQEQCLLIHMQKLSEPCSGILVRTNPEAKCIAETGSPCRFAEAQKPPEQPASETPIEPKPDPCEGEYQRFCWHVAPEDWRGRSQCMLDNLSELPRDCLMFVQQQASISECAEDIQRLCRGAVGPAAELCLQRNMHSLSKTCRERYHADEKDSSDAACADDLLRLCPREAKDGQGKGKCLREHIRELSPVCGAFFDPNMRRCASDRKRFCPQARTFDEVTRCLSERSGLDPVCRQVVDMNAFRGRRPSRPREEPSGGTGEGRPDEAGPGEPDRGEPDYQGGAMVCKNDFIRFCSQLGSWRKDRNATRRCLLANVEQLEPACAERVRGRGDSKGK